MQKNTLTMNHLYKSILAKIIVTVFISGLFYSAFSQNSTSPVFTMPEGVTKDNIWEGKIIFKMKQSTAPFLKTDEIQLEEIKEVLTRIEATTTRKIFPLHQPPAQKTHFSGQPYSDLSRIYFAEIPVEASLEEAINELYATGLVEYAQPWYIPELFYEPNDPLIGSQYYLQNIKAFDAWEVEQGDTNVVIAIVDTGIDLYHPDLINDIAYNYNDPINGEDSDNDGYIDNFYGWDLGDNNNYPQWDVLLHGVHVSGIAGASTDNQTGMAGVGFKSRILPVKISDQDGRLVRSYEGIVYAADQGAHVINCSWGGAISPGQFGQDIINYAVLNKNSVVVAAAGNSNNQVRIFPASYVNAISVAGTNADDHKWSGSSYGKLVDISAPGQAIFSTMPNGSYAASNGTSMAAPIVAGAAALLKAQFPDFNALQIAAQLKVTTDIIDTIAANQPYAGLLGTGRLNIYRALTETHHPYLMFSQLEHPAEYYQLFNPGETFELGAEFLNLLAPTENITAVITTQSPYVDVISGESLLGEVLHMETTSNFENPFVITISESMPASHEVTFTLNFLNGASGFAGQQSFSIVFNLDYVDFQANQIQTTVNSRGNVGFNYPNYNQGVGFLYANANQNRTLIKCAGFVAGVSTSKVVDNIYGPVEASFSKSFYSLENARIAEFPQKGDLEITGSFNDSLAGNARIGIKVDYSVYSFENSPLDKFLILEYNIINQSGENLPGFYTAFFADWALQDVRNHRAAYDTENQMGYAYSASGGNFTGIRLLSHSNIKHYAFDNQGYAGSMRINNGFTSFQKYTAMKSTRNNAGFFDKDNDISTLISAGPFNLQKDDTLTVAFALLAGDHLNDLQATAQLASLIYKDEYVGTGPGHFADNLTIKAFPNPFENTLSVEFTHNISGNAEISVFDMYARRIYNQKVSGKEKYQIETSHWDQGFYIIQVKTDESVYSRKIMKK